MFLIPGFPILDFAQESKSLKITGYAELYYQYEFNNPQ
jgi:hypothetical protein